MKIICTKEEKEALINAYEAKPELPCCFPNIECGCSIKYDTCKDCMEDKIEWVIED